jgi:soluble lytic murein transglycosylase-like protein
MLCLIAVMMIYAPAAHKHKHAAHEALIVCQEVATRARDMGVDPALAVSVAYEETRFQRDLKSPSGAVGPLQALPVYWCPKVGECNEIDAGLRALRYYVRRERGDELRALTAYAGAGSRAQRYGRRVYRRAKALRVAVELAECADH